MNIKSVQTTITVVVVSAIVIGLILTVVSKAGAQELLSAPAQPETVELVTVAKEGTAEVVVEESPPKGLCAISFKGESSWSIDILLAAAEKIEGCTVSLDLTTESTTQ